MRTALESVHLVAATIGFISFGALWAGTLWGSVLRSGWASSRLRHSTVHCGHFMAEEAPTEVVRAIRALLAR